MRRLTSQVLLLALFFQTSGATELVALESDRKLVAATRLARFGGIEFLPEPAPTFAERTVGGAVDAVVGSWETVSGLRARALGQVAALAAAAQDEVEQAPRQIQNWLEMLKDQVRSTDDAAKTERVEAPAVPARAPPPMPPGLRIPQPSASFGLSSTSLSGGPAALVDLSMVPLVAGPNLISLPNEPPDTDPAVVLAPIAGQYTAAFAYDNCDPVDPWKIYDPADPPGSDLTAIDHTIGLWLDVTSATTLPSDGTQPPATQLQLCTGWNLIGYPLAQERPVPAALASIEGKYLRVFGFDVTDTADGWEVYDVAAPDWANDLQMMHPGRGYWVLATEDVVLDYENQGAPPAVEIVSPAAREEIASIVDVIGTVQSNLLDQWTLSYRESGTTIVDATWVEFASGDFPVTAAVLGRFDPTLLLNGMYDIRLQATDFQGQIVEDIVPVAVDGGRKIGAFTLSFSDLRVPLSGLDIEIIRTYDSRDKKKRDFGVGWMLDIKQGSYENNIVPGDGWEIVNSQPPVVFPCVGGLETKSHLTTIRLSDQEVYRFRLEVFNTGPNLGGCFGQVRFAYVDGPVPGATLDILGNTDVLWGAGTDFLFDPITVDLYNPTDVRLRTRDGREFDFVLGEGVTKARDTNGNELTISPTSIAHSSGVSISMTRDAEDRITEITDPMGDTITYEYDAAGDLVAHSDRGGNKTTFTYDSNHGLLDIIDPRGNRGVRSEYDENDRLISTTDADGNTITFSRDLEARREIVTNRLGNTRVLEYDQRGNVTREIDETGQETLRTFDANDNLLSQTDPLGRTTSFTYNAANDVENVTDGLGNAISLTYDSERHVLTSTDPRSNTTTNVYDANGNLTQTTDALGNISTFTYDSQGNVLTETDPLLNVTTFTYDSRGNPISQTDALGNTTTFTYDARGNRLTETRTRTEPGSGGGPTTTQTLTTTSVYNELDQRVSKTEPDGATTSWAYDALGRVVARTDPLGRTTTMAYDPQGRLTATTFPDGTNEQTTYDAEGRALTRTDPAGRVTSFTHDTVGRRLSTTFPDGASIANVYNDAGQLVARTDERSNTTNFAYDDAGQRTTVVDALGNTTTTTYDETGNRTSVTDASGRTTTFGHDALDRLTVTTLPDTRTVVSGYDALGRRTSSTDQAGRTTNFAYDALGRLTSVTDALGQVTSYTHDEVGNRLTQTDANGNTTSFGYDEVGRQTSRTFPDGSFESIAYNPDETPSSHTDFLGRVTTFAYDVSARLTRRSHPDSTAVVWTYTPTGKRSSYTDSRGVTSFSYDPRDRMTSMTTPDGRSLGYAYDLAGNRTSLSATIGAATLATTYSYDPLNRLETVTDSQGGVYTHAYDDVGNRATLDYPNGVTTTTLYDAVNRLTSLSTTDSVGGVLQGYGFTLDVTGRRTRIDEADGSGPTRTLQYAYDPLYRLTQELTTDSAAALLYQDDFVYDPVGNRTNRTRTDGAGPVATAYTYDVRDRLLTEGAINYTWDANGNLTAKTGIADYAWDTRDRQTSATLADGTTVVTLYDPDGNRVRTETTPPGGATEVVEYLVDTSGPLSHAVTESDAAGNVLTHYIRGDELLSLWRPATADRKYFHADGMGSVRLLTDPAAAVTDTYTYTAFGVEETRTGTDAQPYRFTAEPLDPNTGFQYHRARWLDMSTGRFVSVDPFPGILVDPPSLHRYLYASSGPTFQVDPTGRSSFSMVELSIVVAITGILGAAINGFRNYRATRSGSEALRAAAEGFLVGAGIAAVVYTVVVAGFIAFVYVATAGLTYSLQVYRAFQAGTSYTVRLEKPLRVFRWWGGQAGQRGRWWTSQVFTRGEAIEQLALAPSFGNTAANVTQGVIPQGTRILVGQAASQGGLVGQGVQIFVKDPSVVQLIP